MLLLASCSPQAQPAESCTMHRVELGQRLVTWSVTDPSPYAKILIADVKKVPKARQFTLCLSKSPTEKEHVERCKSYILSSATDQPTMVCAMPAEACISF